MIHVLRFMQWGNCITYIKRTEEKKVHFTVLAFSKTRVNVEDTLVVEDATGAWTLFRVCDDLEYKDNPKDMFESTLQQITGDEAIAMRDEVEAAIMGSLK